MKQELERRLRSLCDRPRLETEAGRIVVPRRPIDLIAAASQLVDEGAREALAWNGFAAHAEETWGPDVWRPLVTFTWADPGGSFALMGLGLGGPMEFVATPLDLDGTPEQVIAGLEPGCRPDLVAALLLDAVASNGDDYGFALFGELPSRTEDHIGLPEGTLEDLFHRWTEHHVRRPFR